MNQNETANSQQFLQPAEWSRHKAVWLAWPSQENLWEENLPAVRSEFSSLCWAIADVDPISRKARGENLEILVSDKKQMNLATTYLKGLPVRYHQIPVGDIWLRDTAPIFVKNTLANNREYTMQFKFNGWGQKYILPHDSEVADKVAAAAGILTASSELIFEGGSIDVDGLGTGLTTEQCLLNTNRNPLAKKEFIEAELQKNLGITKLIWLKEGLLNDHTDGHIDNIARFIAPGKVVCMRSSDPTDPNYEILNSIFNQLRESTDSRGKQLEVFEVPSPGRIENEDGEIMPASYVNFYIGNTTVVVPSFGSVHDKEAVKKLAPLFPNHRVTGLPAKAILSGGGAFHCITQQQPE